MDKDLFIKKPSFNKIVLQHVYACCSILIIKDGVGFYYGQIYDIAVHIYCVYPLKEEISIKLRLKISGAPAAYA